MSRKRALAATKPTNLAPSKWNKRTRNLKDATIFFNLKKKIFSGPKALQRAYSLLRNPINGSTSDPDLTAPRCEFWVHPWYSALFLCHPPLKTNIQENTPKFRKPLRRNQTANSSSLQPSLITCVFLWHRFTSPCDQNRVPITELHQLHIPKSQEVWVKNETVFPHQSTLSQIKNIHTSLWRDHDGHLF